MNLGLQKMENLIVRSLLDCVKFVKKCVVEDHYCNLVKVVNHVFRVEKCVRVELVCVQTASTERSVLTDLSFCYCSAVVVGVCPTPAAVGPVLGT